MVDCDDGDPCTVDSCTNGQCTHESVECDDSDACTVDSCDPQTGDCLHAAVECDDGDPCTIDSCDPAVGCVYMAVNCDDQNAHDRTFIRRRVTAARGCELRRRRCVHDRLLQSGQGIASTSCGHATTRIRTIDTCDAETGECLHDAVNSDDGDACTIDNDPQTGDCLHEAVTDDEDACTIDSCDPATGTCLHEAVDCDDEDPCTEDRCVPGTGACEHVQICEGEGEVIQPSIDITKTADKTEYTTVGEVITYTIVVTNTGNCVLTDVSVKDPLTGLDTVIPSLAIGASQTFTETYAVTQADITAGEVLNAVSTSGRDPEGRILEDSAERDVPAKETKCCEDFNILDPANLFLGALALLALIIASLFLGGGELPVKM